MANRTKVEEGIYKILDGEAVAGYLFNWEELGRDLNPEQRVNYLELVVKEIVKSLYSTLEVDKVINEVIRDCAHNKTNFTEYYSNQILAPLQLETKQKCQHI